MSAPKTADNLGAADETREEAIARGIRVMGSDSEYVEGHLGRVATIVPCSACGVDDPAPDGHGLPECDGLCCNCFSWSRGSTGGYAVGPAARPMTDAERAQLATHRMALAAARAAEQDRRAAGVLADLERLPGLIQWWLDPATPAPDPVVPCATLDDLRAVLAGMGAS